MIRAEFVYLGWPEVIVATGLGDLACQLDTFGIDSKGEDMNIEGLVLVVCNDEKKGDENASI